MGKTSDGLKPGDHEPPNRALVVGDGAFAMAMATALARRGSDVRVLCHTEKVREEINSGENVTYLPGYSLDKDHIRAYTSIKEACSPDCALVLLVIPTQFLRTFLQNNISALPTGCPIVACAKGIEVATGETPYEMMVGELPGKYHKNFALTLVTMFTALRLQVLSRMYLQLHRGHLQVWGSAIMHVRLWSVVVWQNLPAWPLSQVPTVARWLDWQGLVIPC